MNCIKEQFVFSGRLGSEIAAYDYNSLALHIVRTSIK